MPPFERTLQRTIRTTRLHALGYVAIAVVAAHLSWVAQSWWGLPFVAIYGYIGIRDLLKAHK